jgi:hypothetical protein
VLASLLSQAPTVTQAAKDILRAAGLPLLAVDDPEVVKDVKKVAKGKPLSPILLVRGDLARAVRCRSRMAITGVRQLPSE